MSPECKPASDNVFGPIIHCERVQDCLGNLVQLEIDATTSSAKHIVVAHSTYVDFGEGKRFLMHKVYLGGCNNGKPHEYELFFASRNGEIINCHATGISRDEEVNFFPNEKPKKFLGHNCQLCVEGGLVTLSMHNRNNTQEIVFSSASEKEASTYDGTGQPIVHIVENEYKIIKGKRTILASETVC